MSKTSEEQQVRAAHNQSVFRTINEQVESLNKASSLLTTYDTWVCECADLECIAPVEMTLEEYEAVRKHPNLFLVAADDAHVLADVEVVTEKNERYWLVSKIGEAGETADELDPRG